MPELPEVETIKTTLSKKIIGLTITGITVIMPKIIQGCSSDEFCEQIVSKSITKLDRRGKYLLLYLTGAQVLIAHLRMTGQFIYTLADATLSKHTRVFFSLSDGCELRFIDVRQFGRLQLSTVDHLNQVKGLKDLGVEPLSEEFTKDFLLQGLRRKRKRIKALLLDQTFIAGLGNIYADEALHRAHINPNRIASTLFSNDEVNNLHCSITEVLKEGIQNRGTTFRDYVDGEGRKGGFQKLLRVYNREGEPCLNCGTNIVKDKVSGRSTYYCPVCQQERTAVEKNY